MNENKEKAVKQPGAIFIPAGILIGMGVGFIVDNIPAGLFIGLGVGFLAYGISLFYKK